MRHLLQFSRNMLIQSPLVFPRTIRLLSQVNVGDKIPINYLKDEQPPSILKDEDYPKWLFTVGEKGATAQELLQRIEVEGKGTNIDVLTLSEQKRLKRLMGLEEIKLANASKVAEKS